jgi:hypothetical protein
MEKFLLRLYAIAMLILLCPYLMVNAVLMVAITCVFMIADGESFKEEWEDTGFELFSKKFYKVFHHAILLGEVYNIFQEEEEA